MNAFPSAALCTDLGRCSELGYYANYGLSGAGDDLKDGCTMVQFSRSKSKFRMKSLLIAILLAAASLAQTATPAPTVAQLLGTWKLVSIEDTMNDGKVQASTQYGPHPHGFIMYQPDGYMCATIVNNDRPAWKDPAEATDAEKIAHYDSFLAYCGTFKLDSATSTVTHFPEVAWSPSYVGSTQPRPFRLEGNRLIITTTRGIPDPRVQKRVLVWERAK